MAYTVPENIRRSATTGERLLFQTLKHYLPDDYIVYYEPEIQGKRPDFVIIGPDLGMIVLEVKDYTKNTLYQLNRDEWIIRDTSGDLHTVINPLIQARDNARHIVNVLKKDKNLIHLEGKYQFHLKFPYGYGAVFTRLSQRDFVTDGLYQIIEPEYVLTREEIDPEKEEFDLEILQEKILNMFTTAYRLREPLSDEDIKNIRYHLFPEVRISAEFKPPSTYQDQLLLSLHDIKVMDLHQENLAKQLGDRHRLIRGVAGSGKTLILASRAKMLIKDHPTWKVLILCYNISLAQSIKQMVHQMMNEPDNLFDFNFSGSQTAATKQIEVRNFHEWLKKDLKMNELQIPNYLEKLEKGEAILPKYDAILIDEGQDFEPEWLQLVGKLLNEETQSLLLVEDRAQMIYQRKRSYVQDTGLNFQGRSKILTINYRNTAQIVKFAWEFYQRYSVLKSKVVKAEQNGMEIIPPQSTKRKGIGPIIIRAQNFWDEMKQVARYIQKLHTEEKVPYSEMLILYRVRRTNKLAVVDIIQRELAKQNLPFNWLAKDEQSKRNFNRDENSIKISTIDSSKGLDFQAVFVVNTDSMPFPLEENKEREVNLLYIAMTRAKDYLVISYSDQSEFTQYFEEVKQRREEAKIDQISRKEMR